MKDIEAEINEDVNEIKRRLSDLVSKLAELINTDEQYKQYNECYKIHYTAHDDSILLTCSSVDGPSRVKVPFDLIKDAALLRANCYMGKRV